MPSNPLYNSQRWRTLRLSVLKQSPLCTYCLALDRVTPATVVDHIRPHRGDLRLFWDRENLTASCKPCHDGMKQQAEKSGTVRGADVQGNPVDPGHHWNR